MTTETLREQVAAGEYDAWEAESAVRRLIETGKAYLKRGRLREAAECFQAASDIARYIDDSLQSWIREYQAKRIA